MFRVSGLKILLAVVLACVVLHIFLTETAVAATDPISVSSQADTINFPTSLDFQMNAQDSLSNIIHATLYVKYNSDGYSEQHDIDVNKPQQSVHVSWHEDTGNTNYSAVGTLITYYWHIQDQAGNVHDEKPQSFSIIDTRFQWQHLSMGFLQVNWYARPISFGSQVLQQASKVLQAIQKNLGGGLRQPVNLWIYAKALDFHTALPPQAHEWVGGIAFPALNQASIVVYDANDDTLIRDMPHELTHLVFHQITGVSNNAPLWFDEGLAVYNQFYHEPEMDRRFKQALSSHSLMRLDDIAFEFPADANKAYLAYGESWKLVEYMYQSFGVPKMAQLIQDLHDQGLEWDKDLSKDIGLDQEHLENQWRLSLNQSAILTEPPQFKLKTTTIVPEPATSDPLAPWLLAAGLLMIVLPIFGLSGLFIYWKSHEQREKVQLHGEQAIRHNVLLSQHEKTSYNHFHPLPETPKASWASEGWEEHIGKREPQAPQNDSI